MRTSEWIACGYFAYLLMLAWALGLPTSRRVRVIFVSLVCVALAVMLSRLRLSRVLLFARDWLPAIYLLQGYWLSGLFYRGPMRDVEDRLMRFDQWLFTVGSIPSFLARAPRLLLEYLELAYLSCFALVPAGFAVLYLSGLRSEADHFWTTVLFAAFACYGTMPWIQTRAPRALEPPSAVDGRHLIIRRLNLLVLRHGSIQVNTFPSGHAAAALAAALVIAESSPLAGAVFAAIALSIATASVVGRYHYAADAALGLLLALTVWLVTWSV